jgi:hypothetical protein
MAIAHEFRDVEASGLLSQYLNIIMVTEPYGKD